VRLKGIVHVDYPGAFSVAGQRDSRIDDVDDLGAKMNVGNVDQSATGREMIPTSPKTRKVSSLSGTRSLPYLWFTYGICKKGPSEHKMIIYERQHMAREIRSW
jgi:hypothetical protein